MYRISTMNKIAAIGLDRFDREQYEVASELNNPDAIIVRSAKLHDMEMPATLKAIARAGAGVNNIPVADCTAKGIVVFNTPGANANAVKELVIAALLLASRGIIKGVEWTNTLKGTENISKQVEDGKKNFAGTEIKGKTLGIIGLGAIGVSLANAALALGMNVVGFDPYISVEAAWSLSGQVKRAKSLDSMLSKADYISIHVPFLPDTKDMIKKEKFALMKDGVKIVNFSRDGIINTADMVEALDAGKVSCYVTDFAEEALARRSEILYMRKAYDEALPVFAALEQRATTPENRMAARLGLLRTGNALNRHETVIEAAGKLLADSKLSPELKQEALYCRATAYRLSGNSGKAADDYLALSGDTRSEYGAESAYRVAQFYYDSKAYDKAETAANKFIDTGSPHAYWLARNIILLSDVYAAKGEKFKAKQYLTSLKANYPGKDDDIAERIAQRLKSL